MYQDRFQFRRKVERMKDVLRQARQRARLKSTVSSDVARAGVIFVVKPASGTAVTIHDRPKACIVEDSPRP